jgi:alkylation response protein AidB-like acyl-CoA dehydrogenase
MMDSCFQLNDTQAMLRDSLARLLTNVYKTEQRARLLDSQPDWPPLWQQLTHELDILGMSFSESDGGLGGGMIDNLIVMETLGTALAAEPYLSTIVMAGGVFKRLGSPEARQMLSQVLHGDAVVAFAATEPTSRFDWHDVRTTLTRAPEGDKWVLNGRKTLVRCAPWATHLLVTARNAGATRDRDGISLVCIPTHSMGVHANDVRTIDGGVASELAFNQVPVNPGQIMGPIGAALPLIEQVMDEATLAVCAEAMGVLQCLMRDTLDYARQRRQFGVPISSFQALQHRLADMHLALEQAAALTASVVDALEASPLERAMAVSSAKIATARACKVVGQGAVQVHGGMGMTEELAVGHYFRRATEIETLFGNVDWHLQRVATLSPDLLEAAVAA